MHPFFEIITSIPTLEIQCRTDLTTLPEPYRGKNVLKAILLGADPTNKGIKGKPGLIELDTVFGINSEFEKYFFGPQRINLKALGIDKDSLFIQNVCRNYFICETSNNKSWKEAAKIWLPFLAEELISLDRKLPILITAEKIMKILIHDVPHAEIIYRMEVTPYFYSAYLNREAFPLYRYPKYFLSDNWNDYREFLRQRINE
jgi:hypothetical protein